MRTVLPELGVGLVYAAGLEAMMAASGGLIQVIEIEPQTLWLKPKEGGHHAQNPLWEPLLELPQRKIIHSIGLPVAGMGPMDAAGIDALEEAIRLTKSPWVSDHLSFNSFRSQGQTLNTGFFLPPMQTEASIEVAALNIRQLQKALPVPFLFETGPNYLKPQSFEMADGEFFAAVADQANCLILLDIHNLWCNEKNGRDKVLDVLDKIPLDKVIEVHLAGGHKRDGFWLDAHSDLVPEPVFELADHIIPRLPNLKALIFEIMPDYIEWRGLQSRDFFKTFERMNGIWEARKTKKPREEGAITVKMTDLANPSNVPHPKAWQTALGMLVIGFPQTSQLAEKLKSDPGVAQYRDLAQSVRAGMVVELLCLTYRLLILTLGADQAKELLKAHWRQTPPEPHATEEVRNFAKFLHNKHLNVPYLYEVLDFDLMALTVMITGKEETMYCDFDLPSVVDGLRAGHLTEETGQNPQKITISP